MKNVLKVIGAHIVLVLIVYGFATLLAMVLGLLPCAHADEWGKGWCAGYAQAVEGVHANRDHYQRLIKIATESHGDAQLRIFSQMDPTGKREFPKSQTLSQTIMDGVDLYVVIPRLSENQKIFLPDGRTVTCPSGERK